MATESTMRYRELVTYKIAGRAGDVGPQLVPQELPSESHLPWPSMEAARSATIRKVENPQDVLTEVFISRVRKLLLVATATAATQLP